jgi:hypothetical protein
MYFCLLLQNIPPVHVLVSSQSAFVTVGVFLDGVPCYNREEKMKALPLNVASRKFPVWLQVYNKTLFWYHTAQNILISVVFRNSASNLKYN